MLKLFVFSESDVADHGRVDALADLLHSGDVPVSNEIEVRRLTDAATPLMPPSAVTQHDTGSTTTLMPDVHPRSLLSTTFDIDGIDDPGELGRRIESTFERAVALLTQSELALDGEVGPLCRVGVIRRRSGMSRQDFFTHWRTRHAPMVLEQGPLFTRYTNNRVLDDASPIDGVVEQWFADDATLVEHDRQVATEKTAIREDAGRFTSQFRQFAARSFTPS